MAKSFFGRTYEEGNKRVRIYNRDEAPEALKRVPKNSWRTLFSNALIKKRDNGVGKSIFSDDLVEDKDIETNIKQRLFDADLQHGGEGIAIWTPAFTYAQGWTSELTYAYDHSVLSQGYSLVFYKFIEKKVKGIPTFGWIDSVEDKTVEVYHTVEAPKALKRIPKNSKRSIISQNFKEYVRCKDMEQSLCNRLLNDIEDGAKAVAIWTPIADNHKIKDNPFYIPHVRAYTAVCYVSEK